MGVIGDMSVIASLIAAILTIVMFFLARKEKKECKEIKNEINQKIEILNKNNNMQSKDNYNISNVNSFDNRKTMG